MRASLIPERRSIRLLKLTWRLVLLTVGAVISAIAVIVFEAPFNIAPGGISGIAIILNDQFGLPIGLLVLLGNIPIQILAWRMLGGWRVIAGTILAIAIYSVVIDTLTPFFPPAGISTDIFLNAVFGGIVGGFGAGLVLRGGGTMGGTSTLGRILQVRYGIPLSSSTLYTDGAVIFAAGLVFGWANALYAAVALFVAAAVADYTLEGPSVVRTAVIITDKPREVADAILDEIGRGVTGWDARGMYTDSERTVLYVTMGRSQVDEVRRLVMHIDDHAFMVIGQGHAAYGHGFRSNRSFFPNA
jgi:uncharacterized membrane-anchored protein YitT (DUF2179 family)